MITNYGFWDINELKDELRKRGGKVAERKHELVERMQLGNAIPVRSFAIPELLSVEYDSLDKISYDDITDIFSVAKSRKCL